jgi:hypothetical protein
LGFLHLVVKKSSLEKIQQRRTLTPETRLNSRAANTFTTERVSIPCRPDADRACAEFYRLPKSGTLDPIFQLSRSKWNQLILPCAANGFKPPIKSIPLRQRGAVRGVRLIVASSAHRYFASLVAKADGAQGGAK